MDLLVDFFVDFETGTSLDEVALFRDLEGSSPYDRGMPSLYEVGSKVAMQNSHAETEDQLHPLREILDATGPVTTTEVEPRDSIRDRYETRH